MRITLSFVIGVCRGGWSSILDRGREQCFAYDLEFLVIYPFHLRIISFVEYWLLWRGMMCPPCFPDQCTHIQMKTDVNRCDSIIVATSKFHVIYFPFCCFRFARDACFNPWWLFWVDRSSRAFYRASVFFLFFKFLITQAGPFFSPFLSETCFSFWYRTLRIQERKAIWMAPDQSSSRF